MTAKIPHCSCGAKRVFELQLLSTMLHVLDVDSHVQHMSKGGVMGGDKMEEVMEEEKKKNITKKKKQSKSKSDCSQQNVEQKKRKIMNNGGMDWSTLLVYSCENSCSESFEEVAIVHRPL
jgi:hypothetical protein